MPSRLPILVISKVSFRFSLPYRWYSVSPSCSFGFIIVQITSVLRALEPRRRFYTRCNKNSSSPVELINTVTLSQIVELVMRPAKRNTKIYNTIQKNTKHTTIQKHPFCTVINRFKVTILSFIHSLGQKKLFNFYNFLILLEAARLPFKNLRGHTNNRH